MWDAIAFLIGMMFGAIIVLLWSCDRFLVEMMLGAIVVLLRSGDRFFIEIVKVRSLFFCEVAIAFWLR